MTFLTLTFQPFSGCKLAMRARPKVPISCWGQVKGGGGGGGGGKEDLYS